MTVLPQTGTRALLEKLSPFLNDTFINDLIPPLRGAGRPRTFSSAQLFRTLLLSLLTPAHSFNLLVKLLSENRAWRKFARLPNQRVLPDAKMLMLHQFRDRIGSNCRAANQRAAVATSAGELGRFSSYRCDHGFDRSSGTG